MNAPSPLAVVPIGRSERWALLRDVAAQWYPPIDIADGVSADELDSAKSRLGVSLPIALCEWYALAGRRNDIWSRQDHFLQPSEWRMKDDHLVFMVENQAVVEWGLRVDDLTREDPPVFVTSVDDPSVWLKENDSTSEFALQMFAYCLKWSNKNRWWANAYARPEIRDCVAANYPRLAFVDWHWPASGRYYGTRDLIAEVQRGPGEDAWLYVVGRTSAAAESFKDLVRPLKIQWDASSEDWPPGWVSAPQDLEG